MKFEIGDTVDVKDRDLGVYGKIKKIFTEDKIEKAVVHFKEPRRSARDSGYGQCEKCGWPSVHLLGNTGELICDRCDHGHGFEEREEIIELAKLKNISQKRRKEKYEEMKINLDGELNKILNEAVDAGVISEDIKKKIFKLVEG